MSWSTASRGVWSRPVTTRREVDGQCCDGSTQLPMSVEGIALYTCTAGMVAAQFLTGHGGIDEGIVFQNNRIQLELLTDIEGLLTKKQAMPVPPRSSDAQMDWHG